MSNAASTLYHYFLDRILIRDRGQISIHCAEVASSRYQREQHIIIAAVFLEPFFHMDFRNDRVLLSAIIPEAFTNKWTDDNKLVSYQSVVLPKRKNARKRVCKLQDVRILVRSVKWQTEQAEPTKIELCDPTSLKKIEYVMHNVISTMNQYVASNTRAVLECNPDFDFIGHAIDEFHRTNQEFIKSNP